MEIPYKLIWVVRPVKECLLSGGPVRPREAELAVKGPRIRRFRVELGYCADSGCWYGLFGGLQNILEEVNWSSDEVRAFRVNGKDVDTGAWLGEETGLIPWKKLSEMLRQVAVESEAPPPDPAEVRALPVLHETWEIGVRVAKWISDPEGASMLSYLAVVLDGQLMLRNYNLKAGARQQPEDLAALIYGAAVHPRAEVEAGRPERVLLDDERLVTALAKQVAEAGITVEAAATSQVDMVLEQMMADMRQGEGGPYFLDYDPEEVRAFFAVARRFYRARPWQRFDGTKYLGFRIGDGVWRYANVMGQAGEEPGLSVFEDWLQLCRLVHNQPFFSGEEIDEMPMHPIQAAGALEGMTLSPLQVLHPEDGDYLLRLGARPVGDGLYALPHRYLPDGTEQPRLSLSHYRMLMEALLDALASRRSGEVATLRRTVSVDGTPVRLVYPANAKEEFEDRPGSYRLVVEGRDIKGRQRDILPPGSRIEIDVPGDTRLDDVAGAIKREGGAAFGVDGFLEGDYFIWLNNGGRMATTPRVGHLEHVEGLSVALLGGGRYPVRVLPSIGAAPAEVSVRIIRRKG